MNPMLAFTDYEPLWSTIFLCLSAGLLYELVQWVRSRKRLGERRGFPVDYKKGNKSKCRE